LVDPTKQVVILIVRRNKLAEMITKYVVGFLFDPTKQVVILIRKNRPSWQAGRINGVGGHVEDGEEFLTTMVREFKEETGLEIQDWKQFGTLVCPNAIIGLFYTTSPDYNKVKNTTDEGILVCEVDDILDLNNTKVIPNIRWMISMALSFDAGESASAFTITEH
jgi:8-oxo-dGTP diphosphatase